MNEGKSRQDVISIETLISKSPALPTYEEVATTDRHYSKRIVQPTFRDLDVLDSITYLVLNLNGQEVVDPYNLSYDDFIDCAIKIDYSAYPTNIERLESRKNHLSKAKKVK